MDRERERMQAEQANAYQDADGVWRWNSNDRVPFDDMLESWDVSSDERARCAAARDADLAAFVEEYKRQRANITDEQRREEAFERRAAFGPGEVVVDVLSGETFRT